MTIDDDDDAAQQQQQQQQLSRRMKQSIESKPAATGTRQKRLGHLDDDSDSDEGFEVMRQKLKPAARTNTKEKKRLNHLPDNDSDSDDDFEVMRQKLRDMQNSKVKEMERRKIDSTARARTISATVGTGSKKQAHAKKQAKVKSKDVETTAAPVATLSTAVTSSAVDNKTVAHVSATVTTSESMKQSPAKKEQIMRERNNDVKATAAPVARSVAVVDNAAVENKTQSSAMTKQEVIELLDDSDSDDDNPVPKLERKRKARPSASSLEDEVSSMGISASNKSWNRVAFQQSSSLRNQS
ncbi:hypothetical protein QTG54_005324 [Skeletonema marinoi]|uniref:Uncharacterized protein n=1 Tax=Skeletonema marinoi TaxID=267567 RepID=A0AAD9DDW0_9STRA|nr:hypothetical protein QTG54_005324 [Skeletonema marinoi]